MNIAIFTNNYLPNPFGVAGSIESFRKEFEKMGHTVYVFAPETKEYVDNNSNACSPGRRVFRYPSVDINYKISFPLAIPCSKRIDKILDDLKIDVIHSQHPNLLGTAAKKWAKKKSIPLIFTWHTLYDQYAHFVPPVISRKLAAWWAIRNARKYANLADFVITPTDSVKEIIKKWGVANESIVSIPTGIDEKQFEFADGKKIRNKYGIADDEILLVVITRFTNEKNMEFLFSSVIEVLKKNSKVKFLAGGDGNLTKNLKELVDRSSVAGQVIFAGFVSNEIKKDYFSAGDIFVYASKSETQGMVISEAMYSGLPVVAVRATGVEDLVMDGASGFLVSENEKEFASAVEKLASDKELRKRFSENAKKIAMENYVSSVCAKKMIEIYEKTIKKKFL
ncbi:MAG: glycosyl transferase group 1 [uncultured bacterium]|nr:MAG: glycosyl transferase group 1 [uncultured bacterium]HBR71190.1 hypothetical protein [Candidatus Moranbacteria bacterium]